MTDFQWLSKIVRSHQTNSRLDILKKSLQKLFLATVIWSRNPSAEERCVTSFSPNIAPHLTRPHSSLMRKLQEAKNDTPGTSQVPHLRAPTNRKGSNINAPFLRNSIYLLTSLPRLSCTPCFWMFPPSCTLMICLALCPHMVPHLHQYKWIWNVQNNNCQKTILELTIFIELPLLRQHSRKTPMFDVHILV